MENLNSISTDTCAPYVVTFTLSHLPGGITDIRYKGVCRKVDKGRYTSFRELNNEDADTLADIRHNTRNCDEKTLSSVLKRLGTEACDVLKKYHKGICENVGFAICEDGCRDILSSASEYSLHVDNSAYRELACMYNNGKVYRVGMEWFKSDPWYSKNLLYNYIVPTSDIEFGIRDSTTLNIFCSETINRAISYTLTDGMYITDKLYKIKIPDNVKRTMYTIRQYNITTSDFRINDVPNSYEIDVTWLRDPELISENTLSGEAMLNAF